MLKWIKKQTRSFFDNPANHAYLAQATLPPTLAGVPLDENSSLAHLPIFAAVNRIATDMSNLGINAERLLPNRTREIALDHTLNRLVSFSPNYSKDGGGISSKSWLKTTMGHLLTWGNSYSEIEFDNNGDVMAWHLLPPDKVEPRIVGGKLVYDYLSANGGKITLPASKVLHFAGISYEGIKGYSPIKYARETLAIGRAADIFGAAFFGNAARPSGMLTHPGVLSDNAKKNLRESFTQLHGGPTNTGRIIVAEEGLVWESLTIPPDDAQFLETRKMSIEDAARLYGMHASKIGGPVEGGSLEERNDEYKQSVLLGWASVIESEIEFKCIAPEDQGKLSIRFDFDTLLRPNATARATYASIFLDRGVVSPNQIAAREGFPTYVGGDFRYRPMNMIAIDPVTGVSTVVSAPTAPAATPAAPSFSALDPNTAQQQGLPEANAARAAVEAIVKAEFLRALRRESATVRKAATKPHFRAAIDSLVSDHKAYLTECLTPSLEALAVVTGQPIDVTKVVSDWATESRSDLEAFDELTLPEQRAAELETLLASWSCRIDTAWIKNAAA